MDNMNNNTRVPRCVHNSVIDAFDKLEAQPCGERADVRFSSKKLLMTAVAAVMCVMLVVTAAANGDFIKSLFQREQELINPHSVVINKQDQNDGLTLTVDKIAEDEDLIYVYYKIHSEKPFEPGYLLYNDIEIRVENKEFPTLSALRASVYACSTNIRKTLMAGIYLAKIEEPTFDVEGILEMNKAQKYYTTTYKGREVNHGEDIEWKSGRYHFTINGLSVGRWVPDEDGNIDEKSKVEHFKYSDRLDIAFDLDEDSLEKMPYTIWHPDTEFTLEDCTFKVKEIKQTAMNLWVTIASETDQVIEIEDQHFNPLAVFMSFNYSNEFNIYDPHTDEEMREFLKLYTRNSLWERCYDIAVDTDGIIQGQSFWSKRFEFKEGGFDEDIMKMRIRFDIPLYTNDVKGLYVYKECQKWQRTEEKNEAAEITIWENK